MLHRKSQLGDIHKLANWEPADEAARNALVVTADDLGKLCWQKDLNLFLILAGVSPTVWASLGGGGLDATQVVVTPSGGITSINVQSALEELDVNKLSVSDVGVTVQPYDSGTVVDSNYVHTDNNYSDADKLKLDSLDDSNFLMTGIISGGVVTLNANPTLIDISPCTYFIQGVKYTYAGTTALAPLFGVGESARRFGLGSSGLIQQTANFSDAQKRLVLPIARVQTEQGSSGPGSPMIQPIDLRYVFGEFGYTDRIWRESVFGVLYPETGGTYSESSTPKQLNEAGGIFYDAQGKKQTITGSTNILGKNVYHVAGNWSVQADTTIVVNTLQYDNGTALTALSDNYWTAHTLLRAPKSSSEFFVIFGQSQHSTQSEAEAEPPQFGPFISESVSGLVAVAKLVVRKGSTTINRIVNIQPRIKGSITQTSGVSALLPSVSDPQEVVNYEDAWRLYNSSTVVAGCNTTDNGNGTFSISSGEVAIRTYTDDSAPLVVYAIPASGTLTPVDNDVTYYFVDYNNGSPVWSSGNSVNSYNGMDKVQAFTVSRRGNQLWIIDSRGQAIDGNRKIRRRDLEWDGNIQNGFWHSRGGSAASMSTSLQLAVTPGKFYYGLAPVEHIGFDTSVAGTNTANVFDYYYNRSNWTYIANSKTVSNTQYDNAGVLTSMNNGRYRTDWIYILLDGATPRLIVVMGNQQHTALANAQAESPPASVPSLMDGSAVLIGRLIILQAATTALISSAFVNQFGSTVVSEHNTLSGIQGGTGGEFFHLTSAQHSAVTSHVTNTSNPHSVTAAQVGAYTTSQTDTLLAGKVAKVTSTDNAIVRYDGTTGNVQNSSVYITDTNEVGIGVPSPQAKLDISGNGEGIILRSPNGTKYRITVDNDGSLTTTVVV